MNTTAYHSPAKINLFLHITGKRPDGYHNLQTVFRLIDLYDTLTFTTTAQPNHSSLPVLLKNADAITDKPTDNLIVKAAVALLAFVRNHAILTDAQIHSLPIVNIALDKKIPMGAGLGGGSSNCATTLMALNDIWQLGLSNGQLQDIGTTLGADVPIFIFGQDAIAEGIGELLTPIDLPPQRFLLLKPDAHINTAQLFAHPQLRRDCPSYSHKFLQAQFEDFTQNLSAEFTNVFEPVVSDLSPSVKAALSYLTTLAKTTQTTPRLTGSGSCVFLPLNNTISEAKLAAWLQDAPCAGFDVKTR